MYIPIPVLAAIGVAFLVLVLIALRRRVHGRDDLMGPRRSSLQSSARSAAAAGPASAAPAPFPSGLPPALELEARALLEQGKKLEAIKRVREETGVGLTEAKTMVERL
jgi:large subunit ribosomal protein L7/L12